MGIPAGFLGLFLQCFVAVQVLWLFGSRGTSEQASFKPSDMPVFPVLSSIIFWHPSLKNSQTLLMLLEDENWSIIEDSYFYISFIPCTLTFPHMKIVLLTRASALTWLCASQ